MTLKEQLERFGVGRSGRVLWGGILLGWHNFAQMKHAWGIILCQVTVEDRVTITSIKHPFVQTFNDKNMAEMKHDTSRIS
jgi:hypothetical protein